MVICESLLGSSLIKVIVGQRQVATNSLANAAKM